MFANGKFGKVWKIFPKDKADQKYTDIQMSTSKKGKNGYETDFNDVIRLIGVANEKAQELEANDRIKILDCGVTNWYKKENNRKYYTFCVFDFEFDNKQKKEQDEARQNGTEWVDMSSIPDNELPFAD